MVKENIFGIIYGSYKHIIKDLLTENGVVYNLLYPGYKWKFLEGGPSAPPSRVFKEDTSEDEDPPCSRMELPDIVSDEPIEISSDSDLERSMVELEAAVSLEFSDESD